MEAGTLLPRALIRQGVDTSTGEAGEAVGEEEELGKEVPVVVRQGAERRINRLTGA